MASRDKIRLRENMYPQLTTSSGVTELTTFLLKPNGIYSRFKDLSVTFFHFLTYLDRFKGTKPAAFHQLYKVKPPHKHCLQYIKGNIRGGIRKWFEHISSVYLHCSYCSLFKDKLTP